MNLPMKLQTRALFASTFLFLLARLASAAEPTKATTADLDGDGKPESISLEWKEGERQFTLKVGAATLRGSAEGTEVHGVSVVDLDSGDKWKEVAVHLGLAESDHHSLLYGFDGKTLKDLGGVHALTEARGNGIVLSDAWMGFWNRREKYVLDRKAWKLERVPQDVYSVGVEATVKQSFALVHSRTDKAVVANLAPGSKIQVIAAESTDPDGEPRWYLVKSSTGLMGWAPTKDLTDKTEGLPFAG